MKEVEVLNTTLQQVVIHFPLGPFGEIRPCSGVTVIAEGDTEIDPASEKFLEKARHTVRFILAKRLVVEVQYKDTAHELTSKPFDKSCPYYIASKGGVYLPEEWDALIKEGVLGLKLVEGAREEEAQAIINGAGNNNFMVPEGAKIIQKKVILALCQKPPNARAVLTCPAMYPRHMARGLILPGQLTSCPYENELKYFYSTFYVLIFPTFPHTPTQNQKPNSLPPQSPDFQ